MLKSEVRVADIITCTDGEINVLTVFNHGPWVSYLRIETHYTTSVGGDDLNFTKTSIAEEEKVSAVRRNCVNGQTR